MRLGKWFRARTRVTVELEGARLDAEGDAFFVERALKTFLEGHKASSRDEPTPQPRAAPPSAPKKRRGVFVRLHAIDGPIAKIYPIDARKLQRSILSRVVDVSRIGNVYIESPALSRQLKGDQKTLWHALMPPLPALVTSGEATVPTPLGRR